MLQWDYHRLCVDFSCIVVFTFRKLGVDSSVLAFAIRKLLDYVHVSVCVCNLSAIR